MRPVVDSYSIEEAAAVLGVRRRRIFELVARGVLAGTPEEGGGMRIFLKGTPSLPAAPEPDAHRETNGNGGTHQPPAFEASPFRELLTEFRNLTERYGQALLALGEARGEVAALRTRVELLEARVDLRLPAGGAPFSWAQPPAAEAAPPELPTAEPPAPELPAADASSAEASSAEGAAPEATFAEPAVDEQVPAEDVAAFDEPEPMSEDLPDGSATSAPSEADRPRRSGARRKRRRGGTRSAVAGIVEALARADDPTPSTLPGAEEAAAAFAELQHEVAAEQETGLHEPESLETQPAEAYENNVEPAVEEPGMISEPMAEGPDALAVADAVAASESLPDELLADDALGIAFDEPMIEDTAPEPVETLVEERDEPADLAPADEVVAAAPAAEAPSPAPAAPVGYSSEWDEPDWIAEEDIEELPTEPMATEATASVEPAVADEDAEAEPAYAEVERSQPPAAPMEAAIGQESEPEQKSEMVAEWASDEQAAGAAAASDVGADVAAEAESAWESDLVAEEQPAIELEPEQVFEPEAALESGSQLDGAAVFEFEAASEPAAASEPEPEPELIFEPEPAFESGLVSSPEVVAEPEPAVAPEAADEPVISTEPELASDQEPPAQPEPFVEPEPSVDSGATPDRRTNDGWPQADVVHGAHAELDSAAGEIAQASVERGVEEELMWIGEGFDVGPSPSASTVEPGGVVSRPLQPASRRASVVEDQALTRMAEERGWDDQELIAIRSLLAGPAPTQPAESTPAPPEPEPSPPPPEPEPEPPAATEVEDEALDWERGPAAWSPPSASPASGELPGATELDEAMSRFGARTAFPPRQAGTPRSEITDQPKSEPPRDQAPAEPPHSSAEPDVAPPAGEPSRAGSPLETPDAGPAPIPQPLTWSKASAMVTPQEASQAPPTPILPGAPESLPTDSSQVPSASPAPPRPNDPDWLRGRRGPAATAYRRLRRLFPG
jgi:hypothetical protein